MSTRTFILSTRMPASCRRWLAGSLLALLALLAAGPAWMDLFRIGLRDEESSQVLLAPFVAAWLLWLGLRSRPPEQPQKSSLATPDWLGPAVIGLGVLSYHLGDRYLWQALWHFGAVLALIGSLLTVTGRSWALRLAPALGALLFLVPVPGRLRQVIALPLQTWTAIGGQRIFELLGVPVERAGNVLVIDQTLVEVAEACNGLRLVFALALVCYLYAFSVPMPRLGRAALILGSPLLAVLVNTVRLVPTAWLYARAELETADRFHDMSGWLMLPLCLGLLWGGGRVGRWVRGPGAPPPGGAPSAPPPPAASPAPPAPSSGPFRRFGPFTASLLLLGALMAGELAAARRGPDVARYHRRVAETIGALPYRAGPWVGTDVAIPAAAFTLLRPGAIVSRDYHHLDTGARASVLLVQSRDARDLAGHYPPVCYPAHGWSQQKQTRRHWDLSGTRVPGVIYTFRRQTFAQPSEIVVYDAFALPGVGLTPDMQSLREQAARRHLSRYGAAHWMVVFPGDLSPETREEAFRTLTEMALPALRAVAELEAAS